MAKAAALSSRKRSELDAELIDRSRPMGPVIRDNLEFVRTCLKAIGMADLRLLPAVAVVDSAEQMGIDEPRFIFKLHKEAGGDSVLMVDKTAFRVSDGTSILKRRIELLHEVVGHKLARLMFPEFVEAAVEAAAADDSEDILITKTIEEVLAWLVTFRAVGVIVRDAANIIKEEELKRIGMPGYAPDASTPVQIQLVMDEMLMKNQELSAFRYRVPIRDFGEKIKRAIEDIYLPAVDNLFYKALGDTAGERMLEEGAIILPDNGERISIKALSVGNTHRMLQAYDGKERRVGMVFAQYDQPSGLQLVSADEMPSGQEPTLGIKGVMVHKDYRTRGLQEALIEAIAKKFSNLNVIHPSVKNPIIIMTAQEKLGFIPVDPMEENALYVAREPGPEGMTEIWLPLPEKKVLWKLNPRSIGAMGLKEAEGRPEDLSGFVKVYANTRYRKIGGDFPRKKDPERTPVEPTKYWAFEDDSADMIVSRAAVNFYTRLDGGELYSASYYAEHYRSHTVEDYDLTFGLKGNNRVAGRIEKWQKEHPGETFRIIDMGTGRAAFLASLGKENGIDAKRLSAFGVNNIAEKEDWDKLTGPALEACSGYAEAGIKYFDFFEGWMGRETDREILPEGYPMTSQRIFHFISEMVRVLKPGGIAHIHVGTLYDHDVELIRRIIENGAKPGLISYGKGVLHIKLLEPAKRVSGRAPAISLIKKGNKWEAYFIDNDQHILINAVWKQIWNEGYEIPDDDVIAGDIRKALPRGIEKLPIHIHSPPGTVFYDRLYELAEDFRIFLPARKDFRLVTHPGTFRGNEGARSFNLLIPLEDLDLLKNLRKEDPAAYSRWLEHEVGHLVDRAASKKGTEKDEEEIVSENPITELVAAYNHDPLMSGSTGIKVRKTETPASRFREVIKGLYDPDPYVRAASARDISGLIRDRVSYPKNDQALRRAIPRLIECLYDNETFVVQEAMSALAGLVGQYRLTEEEEGTLIAGVLGSDRMSVRIMKDLARMVGPSAMTSAGFRNNILFLLMESMSVEADPELQEESMEILAGFDYFVPGARTENLRVALLVLQSILIKGECPEVSGYYGPQIRKSTQGFASYGIRARRKAALALTKLLRRVAAHSGRVALFSGADGTVIYRSLIEIYSGIFSAEMALIHPSSEYRDQNRVIREAASFGVSGITKATFDILMEVSTAAGIMPMRQRIEIAALTTKLMREVSGHIAGILGGVGPIADSPVVKRELMRALAEVVIPGFNAHDTILPRIFDLEEAPLADGGIVELTVKTITRSGDEKALAVLRSLALKSDSELARIIGDSLLQYDVMEEENVYGRDGPSPVGLIVPGPRYHISDIEKRIEDATRQFCLPYEKDESTILSPEKIGWEKINALLSQKGLRTFPEGRRPVLHLIDVNTSEGEPLFGFPIMEEASEFIDTVPVVSYVSSEDGLIHVFMTRTFYDDYIDIVHVYSSIGTRALRVMRLAEILDHEDYENSAEVRALPPDERHHNAALRAREFIPKRRKISSFHKWVIDTLALTPRGIDHITLLLDEQRPQPEDPDQRSYEEEFYSYARGVIPRKKFSKKTQKAAHHIMRAYRYGDRRAFGDICFSLGISPKSLDEKIQVSENEHIKNVIGSFRPEVTVTGTSETDVDIDSAKKIVRKRPKGENTDAKTVVDSYLKSRERLGGLIADLSVIDGTIYQEKVTPLTVYLQHLVAGTGPFERLGDKSYDNKLEIGKDVLRRYMECIIEFAKRGALISNLKVTNFGVRENGEVVLIDLGPSTVIWADDDKGYVSLGKDMILIKSGWDIRRLRDLNSGANAEETGSIVDLSGVPRERELQAALADHWQELITGRKVEAHEEYLFEGGEELLARVEEAFPENISDAAREWRMMTFIPTAAAEDEILELIMQEVETAGASSVPDGSPYFIYRILSGRFSGHAADTDEIRVETRGRAPDGHLSEDTVLRDLNTLVYLGLVEKKVTKGPGKRVSEWKAVMPETEVSEEVLDILISMGPRPTAHEKRKALSEIKEKLGKNDIASLQGIRFVPSNIGNARKTLTAFDRNGEEIGFVYAQQDEGLVSGEEARLGLRGIYIRPKDRHAGVGRALLGEFFREYPGINTIHRTVMNPVLIYTAQKHLGFEPVEPKAENIAYIYISRHPDVRSRIWIPNGDLRFDHRFGPEEAMTGELDVLDEAPGDMAEFIPIYLATVYERPAPAPGAEDMMKEAPRGPPSLEEIYGSGKNISGGVADLDRQYFGNITSELTKKISEERAGPVKILIIGQGRGFEAFELMREHKEEVEVFVASREDLLYLRGEELSARFDEDGLRVTPGEAEHLIKDLRGRFYKYDVEAGIPISDGAFDMVVIDAVSMGNVMDKMRVINEMTRVTREGGTVYCAPHSGFVDVGDGVKTLPEYIYERKINGVKDLDGEKGPWMKIVKTAGADLPGLDARRVLPISISSPNGQEERVGWKTVYEPREAVRSGRATPNASPQEYRKWLELSFPEDGSGGRISPVTIRDVQAVKTISKRISHAGLNTWTIERIASGEDESMRDIYVLEDPDGIKGYIYFSLSENADKMIIEEIAVAKSEEGKGTASRLLAKAMAEALDLGVILFEARIKATEKRSSSLFSRFGFMPSMPSPPGNAVHYKLELSGKGTDAPPVSAGNKGENNSGIRTAVFSRGLPLTADKIKRIPLSAETSDIPSGVRALQEGMAEGMKNGGFLPRVGDIVVPECCDPFECVIYSHGRVKIPMFRVDRHLTENGKITDTNGEEYVFSVMDENGEHIGHGIIYMLDMSGTALFRFSIHVPRDPSAAGSKKGYRGRGYGSETLAAITAIAAKGGLFSVPVDELVFSHRAQDALSGIDINGMSAMVRLLDKAGFSKALSFDMKEAFQTSEELFLWERSRGLDLVLPERYNSKKYSDVTRDVQEFLMDEGIPDPYLSDIQDAIAELSLNIMEHGKGGVVRLNGMDGGEEGIRTIRVTAADMGPGLGASPDALLARGRQRDGREAHGYGLENILLLPGRVTIEYSGDRWEKVSPEVAGKRFTRTAASDITEGTLFDLEFDVKTGQHEEDELSRYFPLTQENDAPDWRRDKARAFLNEIMIKALKEETVIIGVDTSWVPAVQEADVQALLSELSRIYKKKGMNNIVIRRIKGDGLAGELKEDIEKTGASLSNVVLLGDVKVLSSREFDYLRGTPEEGAFFASVDIPKEFPENSYLAVLEMIASALRLASGADLNAADEGIEAVSTGPRSFRFIPKVRPMDLGELKAVYLAQRQFITSA
ncbi:MAG: GNAT family N-acetyltransferase [Candidatus Omnitrophica bacterium]|nr:GNAT family N-acetyltransferase [Candidatus Omnitrophota bacterium]